MLGENEQDRRFQGGEGGEGEESAALNCLNSLCEILWNYIFYPLNFRCDCSLNLRVTRYNAFASPDESKIVAKLTGILRNLNV